MDIGYARCHFQRSLSLFFRASCRLRPYASGPMTRLSRAVSTTSLVMVRI